MKIKNIYGEIVDIEKSDYIRIMDKYSYIVEGFRLNDLYKELGFDVKGKGFKMSEDGFEWICYDPYQVIKVVS